MSPPGQTAGSAYLNWHTIQWARTAALLLLLVALWALTHRYLGFDGDAKLYAVQALARIHPGLSHDLFLQNVSQDRFTLFSPFYAWCIDLFGLQYAELAFTIVFKVWFLTAAWSLARVFSSRRAAFLTVALVIILPAGYGAFRVFQYSEDWLTARSLAEALVITSLALHFRGKRISGLLIATAAMFVHPLMALPGLLLLACLWTPAKTSIIGAAAGILMALALAFASVLLPSVAHVFTIMDTDWLQMAHERSQFLFLQLWSVDDWKLNARPFVTLIISALALTNPRIRKLCVAAMIVGATGLAVAFTSSLIGPVAVLIQGQAWRWVWVTSFIAVLLLVPTAAAVWRNNRCGPLCAILLACGWAFPVVDGAFFVSLALAIWLVRDRLTARADLYLKLAAAALSAVILCWAIANCWNDVGSGHTVSSHDPRVITALKNIMDVTVISVLTATAITYWIEKSRSALGLGTICVALLALSAVVLPGAYKDVGHIGVGVGATEFANWRSAIPADSNVLVVPSPVSAAFAWFILERPSYLSTDQSSGVVFSRQTELEIRRRSVVVLPLWDTNWRLRSRMHAPKSGSTNPLSSYRPLTRNSLIRVCHDPKLNFVIAKENVGFDPMPHSRNDSWKDWKLYDCRRVNSQVPPA